MNTQVRNISLLLLTTVFAVALSGCNTVRGIGKDTERAGEKIQNEADEHQDSNRPRSP